MSRFLLKNWPTIFLVPFFFFGTALSQIQIHSKVTPDTLAPGEKGIFFVTIRLPKEIHLNAESGLFKVEPEKNPQIQFQKPQYPAYIKTASGPIYKDSIQVAIPFQLKKGIRSGMDSLFVQVTLQKCSEDQNVCYFPETFRTGARVVIRPLSPQTGPKGISEKLAHALKKGSGLAFLIAFLAGLLTSLTPCVYPMIPITLAVIGAGASGSRWSGFFLSLVYVLGIGITFSTLGIIAAKTGSLFGSFSNHPVVIIFVSLVFFAMGLSLVGGFVVQMPGRLRAGLGKTSAKGLWGAGLTGILAGLLVSPCITPVLVVILTWVATQGSVILGFGLLFSFAMGLGVLFIVLGTFSGVLKTLPKSGAWMEAIEKGLGILLLAFSVGFFQRILSPFWAKHLWAVFLVFLGTFLGAFTSLERQSTTKQKIQKAMGVLFVLWAFFLMYSAFGERKEALSPKFQAEHFSQTNGWIRSEWVAFEEAKRTGKSILLDAYADWCAECRELEKKTWPDAEVQSLLRNFVLLKLDFSVGEDSTKALQKKYKILGMPTMIILSPNGEELGRTTGFQPPEKIISFLRTYVPYN